MQTCKLGEEIYSLPRFINVKSQWLSEITFCKFTNVFLYDSNWAQQFKKLCLIGAIRLKSNVHVTRGTAIPMISDSVATY